MYIQNHIKHFQCSCFPDVWTHHSKKRQDDEERCNALIPEEHCTKLSRDVTPPKPQESNYSLLGTSALEAQIDPQQS